MNFFVTVKFFAKQVPLLSLGLAASFLSVSHANAQNPPPGAIFELKTAPSLPASGILSTYQQFSTSFVGDGNLEYVSFAFREQPAYFSFDDAVVAASGSSTNLLVNPGFEQGSSVGPADVGTNFPDSWGRWIQAVDTSAIGQVDATGYGCGANAHSGAQFWCDGSVEGYDGIYQGVHTTAGTTYNVSFWLDDNSGSQIVNPSIDMLVYAGDVLPVSSIVITGSPEPGSIALMGAGIAMLGMVLRRKRSA